MFKFIIPAVIIFLIVLFWEKITEVVFKKFNIKISYVMIVVFIVILGAILTLLYY
tara:strand:+ start:615 stop:779 length:165 start_codon:yes stop_codon:yes gene_type:complete